MRPFGIDRLYASFRPIQEEFGGSALRRIECCARTSHLCAGLFHYHSNFSQIA